MTIDGWSGDALRKVLQSPLRLPPNRIEVFYEGGALIDRLRGAPDPHDDNRPEDWVGSTTRYRVAGAPEHNGISVVEAGGTQLLLSDIFETFSTELLGEPHVQRFGANSGLLVKLLDTSIRLPVHSHPDRPFALKHLDSRFGKTEAWIVVGARQFGGEPPYVLLGFAEGFGKAGLRDLVDRQDIAALIRASNRIPVRPGDVFFVPAGMPHAIGPGVFIVELQEPTSFSILMEHEGFPIEPSAAHLGLGWDLALEAVDRSAQPVDRLKQRVMRRGLIDGPGEYDLLGEAAAPFFGARRHLLDLAGMTDIQAGFYVAVVLEGAGTIETGAGTSPIRQGDTFIMAAAAGSHRLSAGPAGIDIIRCLPPVSID